MYLYLYFHVLFGPILCESRCCSFCSVYTQLSSLATSAHLQVQTLQTLQSPPWIHQKSQKLAESQKSKEGQKLHKVLIQNFLKLKGNKAVSRRIGRITRRREQVGGGETSQDETGHYHQHQQLSRLSPAMMINVFVFNTMCKLC